MSDITVIASQRSYLPKLTVGEKILKLRKQCNLSQLALADIIKAGQERIIRVERGQDEYTEAHIKAAKEYFDIEGLPITERECNTFRDRLYYWRDLIRARKLDDAKVIQQEVAKIDNLEPCDFDMVMLCKMIGIQLYRALDQNEIAEKKLNISQEYLNEMNSECLYHYYFAKGSLLGYHGQFEESLDYFLQAYEISENNEELLPSEDVRLYYYISWCYSFLEIPYRAIYFLERARQVYLDKDVAILGLLIDRSLALNYIKMDQLKDAERLLRKCYERAESIKDENSIGYTFFSYGYLYKKRSDWKIAIDYFEKSLPFLDKGTDTYFASLYHMIHCFVHTRAFKKSNQLLKQVKSVCLNNDDWLKRFEALDHYIKISNYMTSANNKVSISYIEDTVIPYLISKRDYFIALDYCTLLELHYQKLNSIKNSLQMSKIKYEISLKCYANHGRDD